MGTPGEGLVHSVKPIITPVGQHVCGRCHGQPSETIFFNYEVCLCTSCVDKLRVSREAGHHVEMPEIPALPEEELKVRAEVQQVHAAEGRALPTPLERLIVDKKRDIHQSLLQVYKNMNSLEEVITDALRLETEVQRLQGQPADGRGARVEMGNIQGVMDRLEAISRENGELRNMNDVLTSEIQVLKNQHRAEVQALEDRLQAAEAKIESQVDLYAQEALKNQLDEAVEMLQASIREQTAETARVAAKKVADVMPLIAQVDLDNIWLDHDSAEKFLELIVLGIGDWISPDKMQEVARNCIRIAKFLGPNRLMAEFADTVSKRIKRNKEEGLQFVRAFYGVFELAKDDEKAKEMLAALLELLEKGETFNHVVKILDHLRKLIDVRHLCDFAMAASVYFQRDHPRSDEWKKCLLSLPVDWNERYRPAAEQCTSNFIRAVCDQHFSDNYLQLALLLRHSEDPAPLFALVEKICIFMKNSAIAQELRKLVEQLIALLDSAVPQPHAYAAFGILKLLLRDPQSGELQLLSNCIAGIYNSREVAELMTILIRVLEVIRSQDTAYKLGTAIVKWTLVGGHPFKNVAFAQGLVQALEADPQTMEEASVQAAKLLGVPQLQAEQACVLALLNSGIPVSIGCEFAAALLDDAQLTGQLNLFTKTFQSMSTNAGIQKAAEWAKITKTILKRDQVVEIYEVYNAFVNRGMSDAEVAELGKTLLAVVQSQVNLDRLKLLLNSLVRVLNTEGLNHELILEIMKLWMSYYRVVPTDPQPFDLAIHLVEQVGNQQTPSLVTAFETAMNHAGGAYATTTLVLAKIYISAFATSPDRAQEFITKALGVLKKMQDGSQKNQLETLIDKAVQGLQIHSLFFLEGVFRECHSYSSIDMILARYSKLINLPDALHALQMLSQGLDNEYCCRLLDIFPPTSEAAQAISKLMEIADYLLQRGAKVPGVTIGLGIAMKDRPKDIITLLNAVFTMLKKDYAQYRVADDLLQVVRYYGNTALVCSVATLATEVLNAGTRQQVVEHLCTVLLEALRKDPELVRQLNEYKQWILESLVKLLNARQAALTLKDLKAHIQEVVLVHVQTKAIVIHTFPGRIGDHSAPLNLQIRVDNSSSWTFLDDDRLYCCGGGEDYAGNYSNSWYGASSRSYSVDWKDAYLLTCSNPNWTVTRLRDMKSARYYHGILYLAQFDSVYVFGGSKLSTRDCSTDHSAGGTH